MLFILLWTGMERFTLYTNSCWGLLGRGICRSGATLSRYRHTSWLWQNQVDSLSYSGRCIFGVCRIQLPVLPSKGFQAVLEKWRLRSFLSNCLEICSWSFSCFRFVVSRVCAFVIYFLLVRNIKKMCHFKKYFKYICGLYFTLLFGLVYALPPLCLTVCLRC